MKLWARLDPRRLFSEQMEFPVRKVLPVLVSAFLISTAGSAFAADARGNIEALDKEANRFELDNGIRFTYNGKLDESKLVEGAKVKVTYKQVRGRLQAQRVRVISTPQG